MTTSPTSLNQLGFHQDTGLTHLARTYMLAELQDLLAYVADTESPHAAYVTAIVDDNCLGKRSGRTRQLTAKHLTALYALDPDVALFRTLRHFWEREPEGRPLLALTCAVARDPLLRDSAPFILEHGIGAMVPKSDMLVFLAEQYPDRFSSSTLASLSRNLLGTWTQSGHLQGRTNKTRTRPTATPGATAYALYLGMLTGARGQLLFSTPYAALLDLDLPRALELTAVAAQRGWLTLRRSGDVIDIRFPNFITPEQLEHHHE